MGQLSYNSLYRIEGIYLDSKPLGNLTSFGKTNGRKDSEKYL